MIGRIMYGACAVGLVAATTVMAEPSNGNAADPKNDPNRQICRTTADTGTRLGRTRECHTAQEWDEIRRQTGDQLEQQSHRH
jgi:hypothetical protein